MKPDSGFVMAMLRLCSVTAIGLITVEDIGADHLREMDRAMRLEAKEVFLVLIERADEEKQEATLGASEEAFVQAGLSDVSADEAFLIALIYESRNRKVQITSEGITVWPCQKVLDEQSRRERLAQQQVA